MLKSNKTIGLATVRILLLTIFFWIDIVAVSSQEPLVEDTDYISPTGFTDVDGVWQNEVNAFSDDNAYAQSAFRNNKIGIWHSYNPDVPAGATITGIEVRLDVSGAVGVGWFEVQVSNGSTFSSGAPGTKFVPPNRRLSLTKQSFVAGGSNDLWGLDWDFTGANSIQVLVRVVNLNEVHRLWWVPIKIYYEIDQPPAPLQITVSPANHFSGNGSLEGAREAYLSYQVYVTQNNVPAPGAVVSLISPIQLPVGTTDFLGVVNGTIGVPTPPTLGPFTIEVQASLNGQLATSGPVTLYAADILSQTKTIQTQEEVGIWFNVFLNFFVENDVSAPDLPRLRGSGTLIEILAALVKTAVVAIQYVPQAGDELQRTIYKFTQPGLTPAYLYYERAVRNGQILLEYRYWTENLSNLGSIPLQALNRDVLVVRLGSPATILITDPTGAVAGIDAMSGQRIFGFPVGMSDSGAEPFVAAIPGPLSGQYTVVVTGTGTGSYTLTVYGLNTAGQVIAPTVFSGQTQAGHTTEFRFGLDPATGILTGLTVFERVQIDVKPDNSSNTVNPRSRGKVPVAILGSTILDVTSIDPVSIIIAGAPVEIRGKNRSMYSIEDVNADGWVDMVVHLKIENMELANGTSEVSFEGQTYSGVHLYGVDNVILVPNAEEDVQPVPLLAPPVLPTASPTFIETLLPSSTSIPSPALIPPTQVPPTPDPTIQAGETSDVTPTIEPSMTETATNEVIDLITPNP